jgi:nicotinate-nucleotide pyrophosphorylase (carboxylating)
VVVSGSGPKQPTAASAVAPGGAAPAWPEGWPAGRLEALIREALDEDVGSGDATCAACLPPGLRARAVLLVKAPGVVAGLPVAARVFAAVDPSIVWRPLAEDGLRVAAPPVRLAEVEGSARAILVAERLALNFLQRLSGIATLTARCVEAAAGRADILDTRKTTPGLRWLERYAVRTGGGRNHRFGLSDGILIKDNHVRACGGVAAAVSAARRRGPQGLRVEVECTTLDEVQAACDAGAEIILLDNMAPELLARAVRLIGGRTRTEASGGVTLANLPQIAATGVDAISLGMLTHSAPALDLSLEVETSEAN